MLININKKSKRQNRFKCIFVINHTGFLSLALLVLLQPMVKSEERSSSERIQRALPQLQSQLHIDDAKQSWEAGSIADPFGSASIESSNYQGLVGRPGIDFPVLTHIPRTVFECENHGNGYFADLEARCQVSACVLFDCLVFV